MNLLPTMLIAHDNFSELACLRRQNSTKFAELVTASLSFDFHASKIQTIAAIANRGCLQLISQSHTIK